MLLLVGQVAVAEHIDIQTGLLVIGRRTVRSVEA